MARLTTADSTTTNRHPLRGALLLFLAVTFLGVIGGCDAVSVESTDTSDNPGEVEIETDNFTRADILFEPVSLSPGETFSIELMDEEKGQGVTRLVHEGLAGDRQVLRAEFDPLNPTSVTVKCRNQEAGTQRTMATLEPGHFKAKDGGLEPVATTADDEPTSYHYIEDGNQVIVEVDYNQVGADPAVYKGAEFEFSSVEQPVQCTHVAFVLEDVSLTADGIQFAGEQPKFRKREIR